MIVSFDVPTDLRDVFGFTQGQYLTLRKDIDGQDLRRSYSICAGVDDGELRVGVRKVQGRHLLELDQRAPAARRHHRRDGAARPLLRADRTAIAAPARGHRRRQRHHADPVDHEDGAGARARQSRFTLIYGNRKLQSTMFKEELEDLKNRYMTRLALHHVFSERADRRAAEQGPA